jgi:ABC-type Fe3+-hydroxamate transport system substrate-binding protein
MMPVVGDNSLEKIGLYIPSQGQKIISSAELIESNPDHIIIFPWNISEEIYKSLKFRSLSKTKFWKISPTIEEIREIL